MIVEATSRNILMEKFFFRTLDKAKTNPFWNCPLFCQEIEGGQRSVSLQVYDEENASHDAKGRLAAFSSGRNLGRNLSQITMKQSSHCLSSSRAFLLLRNLHYAS
jgi:hypothetical protein